MNKDSYYQRNILHSSRRYSKQNCVAEFRRNNYYQGIIKQDMATFYNDYNYINKPTLKIEYVKKVIPKINQCESNLEIVEELKSLPTSTLSSEKSISNEVIENGMENNKKNYDNCALSFIWKMCPSEKIPLPKLMQHLNLIQ